MSKITQKLHTKNSITQVIDLINYFCRVTIEWE